MGEFNFSNVMIGTARSDTLGEFYAGVFDRQPDMKEQGWYGWKLGAGFFTVGPHSEVTGTAAEPQRIIVNFETPDVAGEFARIVATGAAVVKEPYEMEGMAIATFADPDGNYFQLTSPWPGDDAGATS